SGSISYRNGPVGGFVQVQYFGKAVVDPDAEPTAYEYFKRDAVAFVNTSVSFDVNEQFTLRFNVDNLFDTNAPFPTPAGGGVVTYYDGIMGRYFKVGVTAKF